MRSALYECKVMHRRLEPRVHQFEYSIFTMALDLDELDTLHKTIPCFSRNRWNLFTFRDDDHLDLGEPTLRQNILRYLADNQVDVPSDCRILLVTLPRILGYVFNPVSFYFVLSPDDTPICAIAEVSNTFGEMKPYVLRDFTPDHGFRRVVPKHFYVSPFSPLDLCFDFKLRVPGPTLEIHVDDRQGDRRILLSAFTGRRQPLTHRRLVWYALRYPLLTLRVILLIHWHALRLWLKRIPFFGKAASPDLQRDLIHPHSSVSPRRP